VDLPYDQGLVALHTRIAANSNDIDLDELMAAARKGDEARIEALSMLIGVGSPPKGDEDDDEEERAPTRAEVVAYAASMAGRFGSASRGEPVRPPEDLIEDLSYQHVVGDVFDRIRRGYPDAALAWMLAHEGYDGDAARAAVEVLSDRLGGRDVALLPLERPFLDSVGDVPRGETLLVRLGETVVLGSRSDRGDVQVRMPNALVDPNELKQVWRIVPADDGAYAAHLADLLSGLAVPGGEIRSGTTVADVVAALTRRAAS
jgi:hypothetical protein